MARLSVLIIACLTLFGCTTTPEQRASPLGCSSGGRPCEVNIVNPTCSTNPCSASVDFDPVTFRRNNNNIQIRWKLPPGFGFCNQTGDGVFLKGPDTNSQFVDPGIDGDPGPGVCRRGQFKWTARNTVSGLQYRYKIQFHNQAGTQLYVVDPVMVNE